MKNLAWGIDLGGTKIECVVLNFETNELEILCRKRIATEAHKGYEHILSQIERLLNEVEQAILHKPTKIGIGTPGIMDDFTKYIKNANVVCINGKNLPQDLSIKLNVPVIHANDANCFALAEVCLGAGKMVSATPNLALGIIIGTGVGGGIVINNQLHKGINGIAGEWGHNVIVPDGQNCYCGKRGCIETVISGPSLENYYYHNTGNSMSLASIYQLHLNQNDFIASSTILLLLRNLGKAIAELINVLDPDLIVVGGGVSNLDVIYHEIEPYILPHLFNETLNTPIVKNTLGDSAGVIGAALLVKSTSNLN